MAETLVNYVVGKLCDAVLQEVVLLCGVGDKVESVKRELNRIQCFLRDADRKCDGDERVKNWVNELRGVSFLIEDTMDMFVIEISELNREDQGVHVWNKIMSWILKEFKKLVIIYKFGKEMDMILDRIKEIAGSREMYGIKDLGESSGSGVRVPVKPPLLPDLDDTELVGLGADKKKIIEQLLNEKILRQSVVSIVGTGGLGKTTVAQKAYSSDAVKSRFEIRIWLAISQEFKLIDLLKKMLRNIRYIKKEEENLEEEYFMAELNEFLWEKRYLIVMDDVWSDGLWTQIVAALPDARNGSRVLITSRFSNIAKAADPTSEPYELSFLSEEESLQLLLKTALPSRYANKNYPIHLLDLAKQLTKMCDGLPLALVTLGGLLSLKPPTRNDWEKVLGTMVWSVEGKKCMDILSTSYDDMSIQLKPCFMYLACFPEDYEINARILIRLWIAERFIPQEPRKTLEDTGENYLEELAQRYMVIVVRRRYDNSIKTIRVHDLLHDLATDRAKEDNLITVFSNKDVNEIPSMVPRRVVLQSSGDHQLKEHTGPNLRSIHCFRGQVPDLSRYKMLNMCNMEGHEGNVDCNEMGLKHLTQLRLLRFCSKHFLKLTRGQLKNLQTLDFQGTFLNNRLPEYVWGIKTLRHVLLPKVDVYGDVMNVGPPSGTKLENLQTLGYVTDSVSWQTQSPNLINVHRLKLYNPSSLEAIAALFQTLENLISLTLVLFKPSNIVDMQTFPFYQHLQKLNLNALWPDGLHLRTIMLPPHLIKLRLCHCRLKKDPMPELEKLQSLKILILRNAYIGQKMTCSAGGFPCLQQLELIELHRLEKFEIEEGAMPTLKLFQIYFCPNLVPLPVHPTCRIERKE